jgi:hypothetical protein
MNMNTDERQGIAELLGDESMQLLLAELGIAEDTPEAQAHVLDVVGQVIFKYMILEVLKVIPETERTALDAHMGSGDMMAFRAFLARHIDDVDGFLQQAAKDALESVREKARQLEREE